MTEPPGGWQPQPQWGPPPGPFPFPPPWQQQPAPPAARAMPSGPALAAAAAWLFAAVLAGVAPFLRFTTYKFRGLTLSSTETVNGWGRITVKPNPADVRGHGINYGIPLLVAALVLVVAIVALVAARAAVVAGLLGLAASAALAAVGLVALLDYNAETSFSTNAGKYTGGTGLVLMVVAGALGVLGAVLGGVLAARPRAS